MKLHILSDLHLEFSAFVPPPTDADVVILAGDICQGPRGVDWAREHFKVPVLYVPGNHEFDRGDVAHLEPFREHAAGSTVRVLDCEAVVIDGVRFLCATLWTNYELFGPESVAEADRVTMRVVTDFKLARENGGPFGPEGYRRLHQRAYAWLAQQLDAPFDGPTVVVTHHAPHVGSLAPRFADDLVSAVFVSRLDALMGKAVLWVHGHTHDHFDYTVNGTRVLCNPRGYVIEKRPGAPENPKFTPGMLVEV